MPLSYPGSELTVEQLMHALTQALDQDSPSRRKLLDLGTHKIATIERGLIDILHATRAIRNASIPINRLPPEILSRVLEHRTDDQDLAAATHVCRYWRSTLISSPSLWTCLLFRSSRDLDRTLAYLERSKSAPIDVTIDADSLRRIKVLEQFAPHVSRTRSLIIRGHCGVKAASLAFCNPAPSLQCLEISTRGGFVPLPNNFLGQQAPSLRSITFNRIFPAFEPPFPLPNLIEFNLYLRRSAGPFRTSALFRFLSDAPLLQRICIDTTGVTLQDMPRGQVISLESLVELDHRSNQADRILPLLRLPRLKKLRVISSLGPGQVQKVADILPYNGRALLSGATEMVYHCDKCPTQVDLSGKGVDVSLTTFCTAEETDPATTDWFSDETSIPLGQIEDLAVYFEHRSVAMNFPINVFVLENLRVLRVIPRNVESTEAFLRLLHPHPGAGIPCRSLREIQYTGCGSPDPAIRSLVSLVRERNRAGHRLGLVSLLVRRGWDQGIVEELREHVGELSVLNR